MNNSLIEKIIKEKGNAPLQKLTRIMFRKAPGGTWWTNEEGQKDSQEPGQKILIKTATPVGGIVLTKLYENKNRELIIPFFNDHLSVFGQAKNIYYNKMKKKGESGGHYHLNIQKLLFIIQGEALITLEDIKTKKFISFILNDKYKKYKEQKYQVGVFINPGIAHIVKTCKKNTVLLVVSNGEHTQEDSYPYEF